MSQNKNPSRLVTVLFILITITALPFRLTAQVSKDVKNNLKIPNVDQIQIVTTFDKSTLMGRIVKIGEQEIQFKAEFGEITIPIQKIKSIEMVPASSIKRGKYWFPNPNATRLFIGQTGRLLKKGEGYFADSYLFFPSIAYGITNNLTIGGGMSLLPWINIDDQIFYFMPKIGLTATKNLNFAAGALIIKFPDINDDKEKPLVGMLNFVGTYGSTNSSITFGLGYGFVDDELADKPMVIVGGEFRVGSRLALVTENWLLPGVDDPIISYGLRFISEKISVDLAFLNDLGGEKFFIGVPYVDFVYNF